LIDDVVVNTWIFLEVSVTIETPYVVASPARDRLYVSAQRPGIIYWIETLSTKSVNDYSTVAPPNRKSIGLIDYKVVMVVSLQGCSRIRVNDSVLVPGHAVLTNLTTRLI
jgi:hypothetical protein